MFALEMDAITVDTIYGLHSTICGVGIAAGNLATGNILDVSHGIGAP